MPDLVSDLRSRIAGAADPDRAPAMQAYMKSELPFRGVSSPVLHRICRSTLDQHPLPDRASWEAAVRELWDRAQYREERYAALAVAGDRRYRAYRDPASLDLARHLVVTGAWWDLVDAVATRFVGDVLERHRHEATPIVHAWAHDDHLWLRRTAVLAQLKHRSATDVTLLREALEANLEGSPHGREFFIRKAVGWALREHAKTDPDWVRAFVDDHEDELSGLTRREALKHLGAGPGA